MKNNTKNIRKGITAALFAAIMTMSVLAVTPAAGGIWGIDPSASEEELVKLDPWTGSVYDRFALPTISSTDTGVGLAGGTDRLFYINGDYDSGLVYMLDPCDGSTLGTFDILYDWYVHGVGYWSNEAAGYLYTSGCPVLDMHRYEATNNAAPTYYWSTIYDPKAVGGDDTGRIFTYGQDGEGGAWVIAEVNPLVRTAPFLNTFSSPSENIVGMAYDGQHLYVSDTDDYLYIIDADDGTVLNELDLGYTLYALASTAITCVYVDIKPGSCPNPLNKQSKGVLSVAVLGTEDFDVTTIDPETILLSREGIEGGVEPIRWSYEDVATPFEGELCDCHELEGDGYGDLTLKFRTQELVEVDGLDLCPLDGQTIPLSITGNLKDEFGGTPIDGEDCILVLEQ